MHDISGVIGHLLEQAMNFIVLSEGPLERRRSRRGQLAEEALSDVCRKLVGRYKWNERPARHESNHVVVVARAALQYGDEALEMLLISTDMCRGRELCEEHEDGL